MQRGSFCFCPCRAYHSGCGSPRVSAHVVRLALGLELLGFQPECLCAWRVKVSKDARRELRCIWRNSPHGSCTLLSVICTLASLLRNHLRRLNLHHGANVMPHDEGNDEHGESEACEDGKDGRELVGYGTADATACPLFQ